MNEIQVCTFIKKYHVKQEMLKLFISLLKNNTIEDLDVTDKKLTLQIEEIEGKLISDNQLLFKAKIIQNNNEIGYYSLIYSNSANLIDEFFVIY
ncbi:MAG: hypothetical protein EOO96_01925 [Pedobacter sp.]|nr:MAG: hypothetical protein EOO96_01925 [Pedobacter sp.]